MTDYRRLIVEAIRATEILSATSYAWFGARSPALGADVEAQMSSSAARDYLLYSLQTRFYADFYCSGAVRPSLEESPIDPLASASPFVQTLSGANSGSGAREPGWRVMNCQAGSLVIERGGLRLWVTGAELYPTDGASMEPGAMVGVLMPNELLRLSPGFYMALGDEEFPVDGSAPIVRFYWNLRSGGAQQLIGELTRDLNSARIAFRLKVVSDPDRYFRCDAGVLYVLKDEYDDASALVGKAYRRVASMLKGSTPALTKQLAPGLALAENPAGQLISFGMSRCLLLAEGIVDAAAIGMRTTGETLAAVERRFAQAGISLETPYLNAGSEDDYEFCLP